MTLGARIARLERQTPKPEAHRHRFAAPLYAARYLESVLAVVDSTGTGYPELRATLEALQREAVLPAT